jgi:hypothetical protein
MLPDVSSPKRSDRVVHGVSNRGISPRDRTARLCTLPNPRATVDESFMKNFNDQRGIISSIRDSNVVHAPNHHTYTVPPPLPVARDALQSMRSEPAHYATLSPSRPPRGMAAILGQHNGETLYPPAPHAFANPRSQGVSPRRHSDLSASVSRPVPLGSPLAATPHTAEIARRPTAAERFLQGEKYSKPSTLPQALPLPIQANPRAGATLRQDTLPLTQCAAGTGLFASTEQRFDANTRGLNISRVAQEEKLRQKVAQEVKTAIMREKERLVVESRTADGLRGMRIEEGRIASKARQRAEYQGRMASYKFTK